MAVSISDAVAQASEVPVIDAAARLGSSNEKWPFLPVTSNVIDRKALSFIEGKYENTTLSASEKSEFASYLAISTACHALDGWRYLSEAGLALLRGARNQALHLAYYAELRGALSLLAGSGIGILNREHFVLTATGDVVWIEREPTHNAAWKTISEWAKNPINAKRVVEALVVFGFTGLDWAEACSTASNPDVIAEHWLKNWSVDLNVLMNDKHQRNEASYRPDLRKHALNPLSRKELKVVQDVSAACNPIAYGSFEELDIGLLHDLCLKACKLRFTVDPLKSVTKSQMETILGEVSHWLIVKQGLDNDQAFIIRHAIETAPKISGGRIIRLADNRKTEPIAIFSRAFLLLRLASALKRRFLTRVNALVPGGADRWQSKLLHDYGVHSHLWERGAAPVDFMDLDADRRAAEDDLDTWIKNNKRKSFSGFRLWQQQNHSLVQLCRFERIGILAVAQ